MQIIDEKQTFYAEDLCFRGWKVTKTIEESSRKYGGNRQRPQMKPMFKSV